MNLDKKTLARYIAYAIWFVIVMGTCTTILVVNSYFESKSFNRLCNANTTIWDAMVTELRVDGECMKK